MHSGGWRLHTGGLTDEAEVRRVLGEPPAAGNSGSGAPG
jgi:hypothetical protein